MLVDVLIVGNLLFAWIIVVSECADIGINIRHELIKQIKS